MVLALMVLYGAKEENILGSNTNTILVSRYTELLVWLFALN